MFTPKNKIPILISRVELNPDLVFQGQGADTVVLDFVCPVRSFRDASGKRSQHGAHFLLDLPGGDLQFLEQPLKAAGAVFLNHEQGWAAGGCRLFPGRLAGLREIPFLPVCP